MSVDVESKQLRQRSGSYEDLMALLLGQEQICRELLELSNQERLALVENRVGTLEQLSRKKCDLIDSLETVEKNRLAVSAKLATELGLPPSASLPDLVAQLDGPNRADLGDLRHRVLDLSTRLRETNEGNLLLMRKSLELVRDSIRQLRRTMGTGSYGSDGHLVPSGQVALSATVAVDRRA